MENSSPELAWIRAWAHRNNLETGSIRRQYFEFEQCPNCNVTVIPIGFFIPPKRAVGQVLFCETRLKSLFIGIKDGSPIPPIPFTINADDRGVVRNGFHRFYLSAFFGFGSIPSCKITFLDPEVGSIEVL